MAWTGVALAKDRNRWQALVDVVMNFQVPLYVGVYLQAEDLLAAQEGLCFIELFTEGNGITVPMHVMNAYKGVKIELHSFLILRPRD